MGEARLMDYFRVKNWEHYQHYKHRNPSWIKLYPSMLDSYEFLSLPDTQKWQWVGILLLAARTGNKIPVDPAWLQGRLGCETVDLKAFVALDFIEPWDASNPLAQRYQNASPKEREERKKEGPKALHPEAERAMNRYLKGGHRV